MKKVIRYIIGGTYKPLLKKFLAKERTYHHKGLRLKVPPDVFHPGFFFSTKLLLAQIIELPLQGKQLLELGAGSGLIAMSAAGKKSIVTATDINPVAVKYLHLNSKHNSVELNIFQADVFDTIPQTKFDIIAINPPYYKKNPVSYNDYAWYCGENGEYFQKLFSRLSGYIHKESIVLMVLCDGCDIAMIETCGRQYHFAMQKLVTKHNLVETNYIYSITKAA
jgi:release factor glutamine methyltransferase